MNNASFSWTESICLTNLTVNIESDTLVGFVGSFGAGKSSLLSAILGEMTLPFDEQCYTNIIQACCLDIDLLTFGDVGDLIIVGKKGVNISDGQKARIALARALYIDANIYFIDDPLAAVDQEVARRIYDQCIGPDGLLKGKTRLLVTHQTHFLNESADQIIFLKDSQIDPEGHLEQSKEIQTTTTTTARNDQAIEKEERIEPLLFDISKFTTDNKSIVVNETAAIGTVTWSLCYKLFSSTPFAIFDVSNRWLSLWSAQSNEEQRSPIHIRFDLRSSRQIKRLESITRSPGYVHFSSPLNGGLPTIIHALYVQEDFLQLFIHRIDTYSRAFSY
ncbi:unnamed protein product [Rotaria sp. Silwood2]|nr:unnamed protein product [Rotaria sp. Silwood2]CAF4340106.1 unnamed protein product [Rotaria sp. Silwood2]